MDKSYEAVYHHEEEKNWWFIARRDMLLKLLQKYNISKNASILDIGCAGGTLLLQLKKLGFTNLYALDYSADAIALVKQNGIDNAFVMDGHAPEFPPETFDLIISSDSLEHLEHDELALKNWYGILKQNGMAFILVPAFNFLWTHHDDINFHFRRYTRQELRNKVKKAGFKVLFAGYSYVLLFLPTAAIRVIIKLFQKNKKNAGGQILHFPRWLNKLLAHFQNWENSFAKNISFPFGVTTFVVVRK